MATNRTSPFRIILRLLLILLVVAGIYGFMLYQSISKLRDTVASADAAYQECVTQVENGQYQDALVSIRTVANDVGNINDELQGWQWNVASVLPVINQDVDCARKSANVANTLTNNAVMPVIEEAGELLGDGSSTSLETIPDTLAKLPKLYETVKSARTVVASCKTEADALPTSHFDELNQMTDKVKQAATSTEEAFASFDPVFEAIDGLNALGDYLTTDTNADATTNTTDVPTGDSSEAPTETTGATGEGTPTDTTGETAPSTITDAPTETV